MNTENPLQCSWSTDGDARAQFEAWARAQSYRGGNIITERDADHPDVYACPNAQLTWQCWKAALATRQPWGQEQPAFQLAGSEPLWCLHVLGMDDVHPAPTKAHAEKAAAWHNEQFKEQVARIGITVEAVVAPWPHSAESHAAGVADFIPEWLIPQWQLDALEAKDKAPAQGIDLGPVRSALQAAEGLCVCCAAVDGYSRNELHAFGLNMRQQFVDALRLIDSQRDAAPGVE